MSRIKKTNLVKSRKAISIEIGFGKRRSKLFTLKWKANLLPSELTRSESFWLVRSSVKEETVLKYLRLKYFWKELSDPELLLAFSHPKFLRDIAFNVALQAVAQSNLSREVIVDRLGQGLAVLGKKCFLRKQLLAQWDNNTLILAEETTRTIRKHKAFSGWVRNASSLGSKRARPSLPEPFSEEVAEIYLDEYEFLYTLISVGRIETNSGIRVSILKSTPTRGETESKL